MKDIYKEELYDKDSLGVRRSKMKDADGKIILEIDPKHFDRLEKEKQDSVKALNAQPRSCGDCNLCCKFPAVPRLEKKLTSGVRIVTLVLGVKLIMTDL